jgi:hypothetical protein
VIQTHALNFAIRHPCEDVLGLIRVQVLGKFDLEGAERCVVVFDCTG